KEFKSYDGWAKHFFGSDVVELNKRWRRTRGVKTSLGRATVNHIHRRSLDITCQRIDPRCDVGSQELECGNTSQSNKRGSNGVFRQFQARLIAQEFFKHFDDPPLGSQNY